jgi:hypothetical protein
VGFGGEHGLDVAEFWIQASKEIQDLARLGNRMTDVAEVIGELLQLGAIVRDGEITLDSAAKLGLEQDGAVELIVSEETFNLGPDSEGRGIWLVDEIEDSLVDGCVEPVDDTTVNLAPLGVTLVNERRRANMADETEFAKN